MTRTTRPTEPFDPSNPRPRAHRVRSFLVRTLAVVAVVTAGLSGVAQPADAGLAASAGPSFPSVVTVGQTGIPVSITLTNQNTSPDLAAINTVCNQGDALPCVASGDAGSPGIVLVPSCGGLGALSGCAVPDPGVFQLGTTATGIGGTCVGMIFDIGPADPTTGRTLFTPQSGEHVVLPGTASFCQIGFTVSVVQAPTVDQDLLTTGLQTSQTAENSQHTVGANITAFGRGSSNGVTVQLASPAIATVASPSVPIGGAITDTATVTGRVSPVPGATVTFDLYTDATCSTTPVFSSTVPIGADGTATSGPYTTTTVGTYNWIARYSGDANNNPVSGICGDANETVVVTRASPAIATVASPSVRVGTSITDTATVTGRVDPLPGNTVSFALYGPNDPTCAGTPAGPTVVPLGADGIATVPAGAHTPNVSGTYHWIATYNGDANNNPVSGVCSDPTETVVITPNQPAITTVTSLPAGLGDDVHDTASVTGLFNPIAGATVTFRLYGANDPTCAAAPIFVSTVPLLASGTTGTATSSLFTPAAAGSYRWIATYNGDAANSAVAGICGDTNETFTITGPPIITPPLPATGSAIGGQVAIGTSLIGAGLLFAGTSRRRRRLS